MAPAPATSTSFPRWVPVYVKVATPLSFVVPCWVKGFAPVTTRFTNTDRMGVPFFAVSPGNEVQFTQSFESCVWDGKDFAAVVVRLRELLDAERGGERG